jgi:hypothetical protein
MFLTASSAITASFITQKGREAIARMDGSFRITKCSVSDDEIDYTQDLRLPESSDLFDSSDAVIYLTPISEPISLQPKYFCQGGESPVNSRIILTPASVDLKAGGRTTIRIQAFESVVGKVIRSFRIICPSQIQPSGGNVQGGGMTLIATKAPEGNVYTAQFGIFEKSSVIPQTGKATYQIYITPEGGSMGGATLIVNVDY